MKTIELLDVHDSQLLRMLTAQVFAIIIPTLPYSTIRLYLSFSASIVKDTIRIAQENLIGQTTNTMTFFAHSSSFYLYTLSGSVFRKDVFKIIARCYFHPQNLIHISFRKKNEVIILLKNQQDIVMANAPIQQQKYHSKDKH